MGWEFLIILTLLLLTEGSHISCTRCYAVYTSHHQQEQLWESCYVERGSVIREGWMEIDSKPVHLLNGFSAQHQHEKLWEQFSGSITNESLYMQVFFWNASNARKDILNVSVSFDFEDGREDHFSLVAQLPGEDLNPALALMCSTKDLLQRPPNVVLKGKTDLLTITKTAIEWGTKEAPSNTRIQWTNNPHVNLTMNHHLILKVNTDSKLCQIDDLSFKLVNDKNERGCKYRDIAGIVNQLSRKQMQGNFITFPDVPTGRYYLTVVASATAACSVWNFGETPMIEVNSSRKLPDPSQFLTKMLLEFNSERKSASVRVDYPGGEYGCMQSFTLSLYSFNSNTCGPNDTFVDNIFLRVSKEVSTEPQHKNYTFNDIQEGYCYIVYIQYNFEKLECTDFVEWAHCPWKNIHTEGKYFDIYNVSKEAIQETSIRIILVASIISSVGVLVVIIILIYILCKKKTDKPTQVSEQNSVIYRKLLLERKKGKKLPVLLLHANDNPQFARLMKKFRSFLETELHCEVSDIYECNNELWEKGPATWIREKIANPRYKVILVISEEGRRLERSSRRSEPVEDHGLFRVGITAIHQKPNPFDSVFMVRFRGIECSNVNYWYTPIYNLTQRLVALDMAMHSIEPETPDLADLLPNAVWQDSSNLTSLMESIITPGSLNNSISSSCSSVSSSFATENDDSGVDHSNESEAEDAKSESDSLLSQQQKDEPDQKKLENLPFLLHQHHFESDTSKSENTSPSLRHNIELDKSKLDNSLQLLQQHHFESSDSVLGNSLPPLQQHHFNADYNKLDSSLPPLQQHRLHQATVS